MCKVSDCDRESMYKNDDVCQMHYFRFMRNGTYDTVRGRKYRRSNPAGYQLLYIPDHPLAQSGGYVYEHRYVVYNIIGEDIGDCEICGKECSWEPYHTHIDHIDNDVTNNTPKNLRVLCNSCNVKRSDKDKFNRKGSVKVELDGIAKTPSEWSREDFCSVSSSTIIRRIRQGWGASDAIKKTSSTCKSRKPPKR